MITEADKLHTSQKTQVNIKDCSIKILVQKQNMTDHFKI